MMRSLIRAVLFAGAFVVVSVAIHLGMGICSESRPTIPGTAAVFERWHSTMPGIDGGANSFAYIADGCTAEGPTYQSDRFVPGRSCQQALRFEATVDQIPPAWAEGARIEVLHNVYRQFEPWLWSKAPLLMWILVPGALLMVGFVIYLNWRYLWTSHKSHGQPRPTDEPVEMKVTPHRRRWLPIQKYHIDLPMDVPSLVAGLLRYIQPPSVLPAAGSELVGQVTLAGFSVNRRLGLLKRSARAVLYGKFAARGAETRIEVVARPPTVVLIYQAFMCFMFGSVAAAGVMTGIRTGQWGIAALFLALSAFCFCVFYLGFFLEAGHLRRALLNTLTVVQQEYLRFSQPAAPIPL